MSSTCPFKKGDRVRHAHEPRFNGVVVKIEEDDYLLDPYWVITVWGYGGLHRHVISNWKERPSVWSLEDLSPDNTEDTRREESSS